MESETLNTTIEEEDLDMDIDIEPVDAIEEDGPSAVSDPEFIKTVLDMVCGESGVPYQKSKCFLTLTNNFIPDNNIELMKSTFSYDTSKAVINISRRDEFIVLKLDFLTVSSTDMRKILSGLEQYAEKKDEIADTDNYIFSNILITPLAYPNISVELVHPIMWNIQSATPTGEITQVQILYKADDVSFFADDIDYKKAEEVAVNEEKAETAKIRQEIVILEEEIRKEEKNQALDVVDDNSQRVESFSDDESLERRGQNDYYDDSMF